jgi:hypothetical protein
MAFGAIPFPFGRCATPEVKNETLGICSNRSLGSICFVCANSDTSTTDSTRDGNGTDSNGHANADRHADINANADRHADINANADRHADINANDNAFAYKYAYRNKYANCDAYIYSNNHTNSYEHSHAQI